MCSGAKAVTTLRGVTQYDRWVAGPSPVTPGFSSEPVAELESQAEGGASSSLPYPHPTTLGRHPERPGGTGLLWSPLHLTLPGPSLHPLAARSP